MVETKDTQAEMPEKKAKMPKKAKKPKGEKPVKRKDAKKAGIVKPPKTKKARGGKKPSMKIVAAKRAARAKKAAEAKEATKDKKADTPEKEGDADKKETEPKRAAVAKAAGDVKKATKTKKKKQLPVMNISTIRKAVKVATVTNTMKPGIVRVGKLVKSQGKPKTQTFIKKPIGGEKNGGFRMVRVKKLPAYYATQLGKKRRPKRIKKSFRPLRSSLTPGTICILLAGVHRGKKVVFLKQLTGGLCLITGPFKVNGCPLRRVNQIYLVATSTKIDVTNVEVPAHVNDKYFRRLQGKRPKKEESDIFEQKKEKYVPSEQRKTDQLTVDDAIMAAIKKQEDKKLLFKYLGSKFGLRNKMYPHRLNF